MARPTFQTPDGDHVPTVTADEMRAVDRVAIEEVGLDLTQIMENAGRTLAWHAMDLGDGPALIIAGAGGNGGGGLVCARHLTNHGVSVEVVLDRDPAEFTDVPNRQLTILQEMGVSIHPPADLDLGRDTSVIVDALIGYGLHSAVQQPAQGLIEMMNEQPDPVVSFDLPSGIDATTGEIRGVAVDPDRTLTLALPKPGLVDRPEPVYLADISIPMTVYDRLDIDYTEPFGQCPWVKLSQTVVSD